jgi:hypothetical protein
LAAAVSFIVEEDKYTFIDYTKSHSLDNKDWLFVMDRTNDAAISFAYFSLLRYS